MNKHAIIVIKNKDNEYLQYYDNRWDSYLFLNYKLNDNFNNEIIINFVSNKLNISKEDILCKYISDKIHTKYSVSYGKEKQYHHFFYEVEIKNIPNVMNNKQFEINDIKYVWYSYEYLINNKRIQEVNSDIVGFIKELGM